MASQRCKRICLVFLLLLIGVVPSISLATVQGNSYSKQNFVLKDETIQFLDIENNNYYNGTISVTVTTGANVTATVNGVIKTVTFEETSIFQIYNVSKITFSLSTGGFSQGYYEVSLIILNKAGNAAYIALAVVGGIGFLFASVSFYIRSKKYQTKPEEEDEELADPETLKKRREAAGAEQKFWGFKEKK